MYPLLHIGKGTEMKKYACLFPNVSFPSCFVKYLTITSLDIWQNYSNYMQVHNVLKIYNILQPSLPSPPAAILLLCVTCSNRDVSYATNQNNI